MKTEDLVKYKLYNEFIKPTTQKKNYIGVEIEIPIINLDKKAVNFDVVHKVTDEFQNEYPDFKTDGIDFDGNVFSLKNSKTDDTQANPNQSDLPAALFPVNRKNQRRLPGRNPGSLFAYMRECHLHSN